jgi:hypothetical protein
LARSRLWRAHQYRARPARRTMNRRCRSRAAAARPSASCDSRSAGKRFRPRRYFSADDRPKLTLREWCLNLGYVLGGKVHVRPARSIFSNALNFCRSAIAALVRWPDYSITPSARTKNVSEIARPSVLAVLILTISSFQDLEAMTGRHRHTTHPPTHSTR